MPPPIPLKALTTTKDSKERQNPLASEKMANVPRPISASRWWPKMAPNRPDMRTNVLWVTLKLG